MRTLVFLIAIAACGRPAVHAPRSGDAFEVQAFALPRGGASGGSPHAHMD